MRGTSRKSARLARGLPQASNSSMPLRVALRWSAQRVAWARSGIAVRAIRNMRVVARGVIVRQPISTH
jgi:hypothetical protein